MTVEIIGINEEASVADVLVKSEQDTGSKELPTVIILRFMTAGYVLTDNETPGYLVNAATLTLEIIQEILDSVPPEDLVEFAVPQEDDLLATTT